MPKIDTSTIEGYAEMSAEDKLAALEAYEYSDGADELSKYKNATSKANSEAAEYKRQLKEAQERLAEADAKANEGQTDAERQLAEMQKQLDAMRHEKVVSDNTARFVSNGFSAELSARAAVALADGDAEQVFAAIAEFIETHDKALRAELATGSIAPDKGNKNPGSTGMTIKKLRAMSPAERARYAAQHPDEYAQLYK